ncbi:MAG TPA: hypothetical protein VGF02_03025, partial [Pseudolabrys sp.]
MPPDANIALAALRSLEDALAQAEHGRVRPQWWHRLALSCLMQAGIAEPWQCRDFWKAMGDAHAWTPTPAYARSMRIGTMSGFLNTWWYRA